MAVGGAGDGSGDGGSGNGGSGSDAAIARLKGLLAGRPAPPRSAGGKGAEERCELCGTPIPPDHRHMVNLETRSLLCACRPCGMLFTRDGAAGGKYRTIPERYLYPRDLMLTEAQWEGLQIPVGIAFFFHHSGLGHAAAFYPSPAGATESLLPLGTWEELAASNPLLASLEPDVEALLVYKRPAGFECYVVPIDACYELVGRIRRRWRGFEGGEEAWSEIADFFAMLRLKSGEELEPAASEPGLAPEPEGGPCPS